MTTLLDFTVVFHTAQPVRGTTTSYEYQFRRLSFYFSWSVDIIVIYSIIEFSTHKQLGLAQLQRPVGGFNEQF